MESENLLCAWCLVESDAATPAVTLLDGTAMCKAHAREISARVAEEADEQERQLQQINERVQALRPDRPGRS